MSAKTIPLLGVDDTSKPNRNQRRKQRTRDAILQAADSVFRRKGVTSTTVNDVTDAADVAYGSFYNHFKSIDDVVAALAENKFTAAAQRTVEIFSHAKRVEILPFIGARVMMRLLSSDPAIRWLLERPYIFVAEFDKTARLSKLPEVDEAVASGIFKPVGGYEAWVRIFPWVVVGELNQAIVDGDLVEAEERFASLSCRMLGIDETSTSQLIEESRALVKAAGLDDLLARKRGTRAARTPAAKVPSEPRKRTTRASPEELG
jgi:AcrR family transcriptional regulator